MKHVWWPILSCGHLVYKVDFPKKSRKFQLRKPFKLKNTLNKLKRLGAVQELTKTQESHQVTSKYWICVLFGG